MASANFVEVVLTCSSWQEAQTIADTLLSKRLVACAEFIDSKPKERNTIKLVMETIADQFEAIAAEIKKLPGVAAPTLQMLPMAHVSPGAQAWLEDEIK
jgi:uncharacterized protein involved in tolerance to divalent cations